jgi:hypothetical protein
VYKKSSPSNEAASQIIKSSNHQITKSPTHQIFYLIPPLTLIFSPFTHAESSDARKTATLAISPG